MCGQEAECGGDQRKMTEAIQVGKQEDRQRKWVEEFGAGERGCFKPGEGKCIRRGAPESILSPC